MNDRPPPSQIATLQLLCYTTTAIAHLPSPPIFTTSLWRPSCVISSWPLNTTAATLLIWKRPSLQSSHLCPVECILSIESCRKDINIVVWAMDHPFLDKVVMHVTEAILWKLLKNSLIDGGIYLLKDLLPIMWLAAWNRSTRASDRVASDMIQCKT